MRTRKQFICRKVRFFLEDIGESHNKIVINGLTCLRQVKDGMNGAKRFAVFSVPTTIARQLLVGTVSQPAFAKVQVAWYRFNHA